MRRELAFAALACLFVVSSGLADVQSLEDDDEYEEVIIRRRKKKRSVEKDRASETGATTAEANSASATTPVAVPAAVGDPAVVTIPVATPEAVVASKGDDKPEEPPPPPEPPAAEAAEPRRLVHYFCKAWKDKDYERLWWAMSSEYRDEVPLKKFKKLFVSDAEINGGLLDENILETAKTKDGNEGVKVELIFKFPKAQHRFVMAVAERQTGGQFRLVDSPFIPIDLDDL